jgi:Asp/Glu/hydantoin racemase
MDNASKRFRFRLIQAFSLPDNTRYALRPMHGPKESQLMNYPELAHLLTDVEWDLHPGAPASHGNWPVVTREEFSLVGVNRLPIVRASCESGKFDAIVLLGGGDPGYGEAREIGRDFGIPVTSCAHAQMHIAIMLGNRFSIVDISEAHNTRMEELVVLYRFDRRCASIRNIDFPLPRPPEFSERPIHPEKNRLERGEASDLLEAATRESIAAIEEDGAEVILLGCSAIYWLQPFLQRRLAEIGWEVPVLEGYSCAIEQAKLMVDLGLSASRLAFPSDHPGRSRRKRIF